MPVEPNLIAVGEIGEGTSSKVVKTSTAFLGKGKGGLSV